MSYILTIVNYFQFITVLCHFMPYSFKNIVTFFKIPFPHWQLVSSTFHSKLYSRITPWEIFAAFRKVLINIVLYITDYSTHHPVWHLLHPMCLCTTFGQNLEANFSNQGFQDVSSQRNFDTFLYLLQKVLSTYLILYSTELNK